MPTFLRENAEIHRDSALPIGSLSFCKRVVEIDKHGIDQYIQWRVLVFTNTVVYILHITY